MWIHSSNIEHNSKQPYQNSYTSIENNLSPFKHRNKHNQHQAYKHSWFGYRVDKLIPPKWRMTNQCWLCRTISSLKDCRMFMKISNIHMYYCTMMIINYRLQKHIKYCINNAKYTWIYSNYRMINYNKHIVNLSNSWFNSNTLRNNVRTMSPNTQHSLESYKVYWNIMNHTYIRSSKYVNQSYQIQSHPNKPDYHWMFQLKHQLKLNVHSDQYPASQKNKHNYSLTIIRNCRCISGKLELELLESDQMMYSITNVNSYPMLLRGYYSTLMYHQQL